MLSVSRDRNKLNVLEGNIGVSHLGTAQGTQMNLAFHLE